MGISQNFSGLKRDGPLLTIVLKVLTLRLYAGERVMVSANKRSSTLANTLRYRCQKSHARNLTYLLRFYYASAILSDKI